MDVRALVRERTKKRRVEAAPQSVAPTLGLDNDYGDDEEESQKDESLQERGGSETETESKVKKTRTGLKKVRFDEGRNDIHVYEKDENTTPSVMLPGDRLLLNAWRQARKAHWLESIGHTQEEFELVEPEVASIHDQTLPSESQETFSRESLDATPQPDTAFKGLFGLSTDLASAETLLMNAVDGDSADKSTGTPSQENRLNGMNRSLITSQYQQQNELEAQLKNLLDSISEPEERLTKRSMATMVQKYGDEIQQDLYHTLHVDKEVESLRSSINAAISVRKPSESTEVHTETPVANTETPSRKRQAETDPQDVDLDELGDFLAADEFWK